MKPVFFSRLRQFEFQSMRARLLFWMTLLVMLPVVLLVVIGLGYAEEQLRHRVTTEMRHSAATLMKTLDGRVDVQIEDNRILSRSPYLQQALKAFSAVFGSREIYSMEYQELEDRYRNYLAYYAEKQGLTDLLLVNLDGDVVFSASQSALYGRNLLHGDFIGSPLRKAFERALWHMDSVIEISPADTEQYATLAAPVVDRDILGVVIQMPSVSILGRLIEVESNDSDVLQSLYIASDDGTFQQIGQQLSTRSGSHLNRLLTSSYLGTDISAEIGDDEATWLVSLKPVPALNGVVMVRQNKSKALAAVRDLRISASIGSGVLMVVLLMVGRRVSGSLTRPLKELAVNFEKIGNGQRQVRVDEDRRDELGMLAREFNRMALSLRNTQAQLVQTEKMASIGQLAAGVAHEINNPMSVVTANIDTMRQYTDVYIVLIDLYDRYIRAVTDGNTEDAEQLAEKILQYQQQEDIQYVYDDMRSLVEESLTGLGRVKHIVGSLRVFSELDKAEEQAVDLNEVIQHVIADLPAEVRQKVVIEVDIRISDPICFKAEQMRKVFAALLDNARRACDENGKVRIRAWSDKKHHLIEFQDNGSGIEDARIAHIFNPFFTTRPVGEGLGLGLSVAHSIVEAHGGHIRVQSKVGQGTRLRIALPRAKQSEPV